MIVAFNLRFPGQYFDQETATHYNYFRDYDPSIGRYVQSDPVGLTGGTNTYLYVDGNPLRTVDSRGLCPECDEPWRDCMRRANDVYWKCMKSYKTLHGVCELMCRSVSKPIDLACTLFCVEADDKATRGCLELFRRYERGCDNGFLRCLGGNAKRPGPTLP